MARLPIRRGPRPPRQSTWGAPADTTRAAPADTSRAKPKRKLDPIFKKHIRKRGKIK